jgi:hypothetical protein
LLAVVSVLIGVWVGHWGVRFFANALNSTSVRNSSALGHVVARPCSLREGKRVYRGRDGESGGGGLEALRKDPRGVYVRVRRKVQKDAMRR